MSATLAAPATATPVKTRLDTLPVEVLRNIFMQLGDSAPRNDSKNHQYEFSPTRTGPAAPDTTVRDTLQGIQDDPQSSAVLRRLAFEELHRRKSFELTPARFPEHKTLLDALSAGTALLKTVSRDDRDGGNALSWHVREVHLSMAERIMDYGHFNFINPLRGEPGYDNVPPYEKGDAVRLARIARLAASYNKFMDIRSAGRTIVPRIYSYDHLRVPRAETWADMAVRVLDLLAAVPRLQRLESTMDEVAIIPVEESTESTESTGSLSLPRLEYIKLGEPSGYQDTENILDMNCSLFHAAQNLRELHLDEFYRIVTSSSSPPVLPKLSTLHIEGYCYLTATSINTLLGAVGPQLASVTLPLARSSSQASFAGDGASCPLAGNLRFLEPERRNITTATLYDVLTALQPWKASSLKHLDVRRSVDLHCPPDIDERHCNEWRGYRGPRYPDVEAHDSRATSRAPLSSASLLVEFTALASLSITIDLFDWRTAADAATLCPKSIRAAAADVVAHLPPNLERLTIHPALAETNPNTHRRKPENSFWARREELARALLVAVRAGKFPRLKAVTILPEAGETTTVEINVPGSDKTRTLTLSAYLAGQLARAAPTDDYVWPYSNARHCAAGLL